MPDIGDVYKGDWIKATNRGEVGIEGNPREAMLTITGTGTNEFDDGTIQVSLEFAETDMQLGLNKTNANTIATKLNQSNTDYWPGARVKLIAVPQPRAQTGYGISVVDVIPGTLDDASVAPNPVPAPAATAITDPFGSGWAAAIRDNIAGRGCNDDDLRAELIRTYQVPESMMPGQMEGWSRSINADYLKAAMTVVQPAAQAVPPAAGDVDGLPF